MAVNIGDRLPQKLCDYEEYVVSEYYGRLVSTYDSLSKINKRDYDGYSIEIKNARTFGPLQTNGDRSFGCLISYYADGWMCLGAKMVGGNS